MRSPPVSVERWSDEVDGPFRMRRFAGGHFSSRAASKPSLTRSCATSRGGWCRLRARWSQAEPSGREVSQDMACRRILPELELPCYKFRDSIQPLATSFPCGFGGTQSCGFRRGSRRGEALVCRERFRAISRVRIRRRHVRPLVQSFSSEIVRHPNMLRQSVTDDRSILLVDPNETAIPAHSELTYTPLRPEMQWFLCVKAASSGGETTVYDGCAILEAMKPATRKTFVDKRLKWKMEQPVPRPYGRRCSAFVRRMRLSRSFRNFLASSSDLLTTAQ